MNFKQNAKQIINEKKKMEQRMKRSQTSKVRCIHDLCHEIFWNNFNIFNECKPATKDVQIKIRNDIQKAFQNGLNIFHIHPLARKTVKFIFLELGLVPIAYPFSLYDDDIKIYDVLDIIAWNKKTETYACIDIQIGFEKYYGNHNDNMNCVEIPIDNSTLNQHLFQLLVKREMLRVNTGIEIDENECYLVRAIPESDEIVVYFIPSFLFQQGDRIYKSFCKKRMETLPFINHTKIEMIS